MVLNKSQFTIKESKDKSIARFFISYSSNCSNTDNKQKSYQLLSLLKQQNDVLLEIDSALTTLPNPSETDTAIEGLLKDLKGMGIDYRHQKSEAKDNKSLFGIFNLNKTHIAHRILTYVPDKIWREDRFQKFLPSYGVRYYICKQQVVGDKLLEDLHCGRILDDEKKALFNLVIYDCSDFGQMGINTNLSKEELQKLLDI
jgi:hypothetical protein